MLFAFITPVALAKEYNKRVTNICIVNK